MLIGSKRVSLLIAPFFNNFEAKANVPFVFLTQFELKLLLSTPKLLGFDTAVKKKTAR